MITDFEALRGTEVTTAFQSVAAIKLLLTQLTKVAPVKVDFSPHSEIRDLFREKATDRLVLAEVYPAEFSVQAEILRHMTDIANDRRLIILTIDQKIARAELSEHGASPESLRSPIIDLFANPSPHVSARLLAQAMLDLRAPIVPR